MGKVGAVRQVITARYKMPKHLASSFLCSKSPLKRQDHVASK